MPKLHHPTLSEPSSLKKVTAFTWLLTFGPVILWAGMIFFLSAQSSLHTIESTAFDFFSKKIAHLSVYAVLYFLLYRAFKQTMKFERASTYWLLPLIICVLYSISDEFHQSLVPGRFPSPRDVAYDTLGATIALLRQYGYI